jgi:hypothetical protein
MKPLGWMVLVILPICFFAVSAVYLGPQFVWDWPLALAVTGVLAVLCLALADWLDG